MDSDSVRAAVARQGALVRELKQNGGAAADITSAVQELKVLKAQLEKLTLLETPPEEALNKKVLEDLLLRKMFLVPSFEIYGGVGGFYDFGPPGCALKTNMLQLWRQHFLVEDDMLEIECTNIMPEIVLKTSGHVERFTDLMVKCTKSGECYRADKLLEDFIEQLLAKDTAMSNAEQETHRVVAAKADSYTADEMHELLKQYNITSPSTGAELTKPIPFNLMFQCQIGPEGNQIGYLRPETAQGIFLNFRRLLEYNAGKVPFGVAQIGNAFRNEISPRNCLIRVREFQQAEIEYFLNPNDKSHPKFQSVANLVLTLYPKHLQLSTGKTVQMTVQDAVKQKIIANESLGYFIAKTHLFVEKIGINLSKVRFRQHLDTEMAHYACDCWDLEIKMSSGWVECAGHADRSCYDLQVHAAKSKVEMVGTMKYDTPIAKDFIDMQINKGLMGKTFKKELKQINTLLQALTMDQAIALEQELASTNQCVLDNTFTLTREMISFAKKTKMVSEEKFVPSVIEPSFGIGRVLTALFEHTFYLRENDEKRNVMKFPVSIAPIKIGILSLSSNLDFLPYLKQLEHFFQLTHYIKCKVDNSSVAIGRKYARADELGISFGITVDFETISNQTVTIRERDSCKQIRVPLQTACDELLHLVHGNRTWNQLSAKYPVLETKEEDN